MREIVSTMTSKGQITVPIEVRRKLGISAGDKVVFVIGDEGNVELHAPIYPTVASLSGAAGCLKQPLSWEEMRAIIREEQANAVQAPDA